MKAIRVGSSISTNSSQLLQARMNMMNELSFLIQAHQIQCSQVGVDRQWNSSLPLVLMTPFMIQKMKLGGSAEICRLIKIQDIFKNADNSTLNILIALNNNLEPSILSIAISRSKQHTQPLLFCQLQFMMQVCGRVPNLIITDEPEQYQQQLSSFNQKYKTNTQVHMSFHQKHTLLKQTLINSYIRKHPYIHQDANKLIIQILEESDQRKCYKKAQKLKQWNPHGYQQLFQTGKNQLLFSELPIRFYGFYLWKEYEDSIFAYIKKLLLRKIKNQLELVHVIVTIEENQLEMKRVEYKDTFDIFSVNSRIWQLNYYIQPNPFEHFINNYIKSRSLKPQQINQSAYIMGGRSGQGCRVQKDDQQWVCECRQTHKMGLPCKHLIKLFIILQLNFKQTISQCYHMRKKIPIYSCQKQ